MKKHNPDHICAHGLKLWWNFGDGRPRHFSRYTNEPMMAIYNNPGEETKTN